MSLKQVPWFRVGVEGFVIVSSILLAFAIDAGWDERQERKDERELYETLWSDLGQLYAQARGVRDDHRRYMDAAAELLTVLSPGEPVPTDPRTDTLIARALFNFRTLDERTTGLDFALANTHLIQNDSLLGLLQTVPALVEDLREDEDLVMTQVVTSYWEHVGARTEVGPYMSIDLYGFTSTDGTRAVPSVEDRGVWMADRALINLVSGRLRLEQGTYGPAVRLLERLDRIGDVLADELGRQRSPAGG